MYRYKKPNIDQILNLRVWLDSRYQNKSLLTDWRDETLLSRPAKKKKQKKAFKVKIELEDISDGKL